MGSRNSDSEYEGQREAGWLNPTPRAHWDHTPSIQLVREIIGEKRMFPLTIEGLDGAMRELSR